MRMIRFCFPALWILCLCLTGGIWSQSGCSPAPSTNDAASNDSQVADNTPTDNGDTPDPVNPADQASPDSGQPQDNHTPSDQGTPQDSSPSDQPIKTSTMWYGDIQPIIQQNCQTCHQADGIGPFPLTTYEEVKAKAALVKWAVETRRMPPFMPDNPEQCLPLDHSRRLSQAQVDLIKGWVDGGTPMGDPKNSVNYTPKIDKLEWTDIEVGMQTSYTPPDSNPNDFHCFITKPVLDQPKELVGFQFMPGAKGMVHHVLIYGVSESYGNNLEQKYPEKHWSCSTGSLFNSSSLSQTVLLGVWVPGTDVIRFPAGTGMSMKAGDRIVLEFHYNLGTIGKPIADQSNIRLQFAKDPVKYKLKLSLQVQPAIAIPKQSKGFEVKQTLTLSAPTRVWGFMPHMHKQGVKFSTTIEKVGGDKSCLVDITRWDYNWQESYFFKSPEGILLSKGDKVHLKCTFDNPTDRVITWGERTEDEMCLSFYFVSAP